jgi:hypothetical protein
MQIPAMTQSLSWLNGMLSMFTQDEIIVPTKYREKVLETKALLDNGDCSGLVNSILDFGMKEASNCDLVIETDNGSLNDILNSWLKNINESLRGEIPVGYKALAKEYNRERYKGSSLLLLRTLWEEKDGWNLPTKMWFVNGEDIINADELNKNLDASENIKTLNIKNYAIRLNKRKALKLNNVGSEKLFVQRPYGSWGDFYTTPFIIQRGIFKNLKFLALLIQKGEFVVAKAIELLTVIKKGTEDLALKGSPDFIYSEEDLKKVKNDLKAFIQEKNSSKGVSTYATNFDTEIETLIPDYEKALKDTLYSPIEKRILCGLGMVEIIDGATTSRKDAVLNPKPFASEFQGSATDFATLIRDISNTILEKNKDAHRNFSKVSIRVNASPIKAFLSNDAKVLLRSAYDKGCLSKQTFVEVVGESNFEVEVERRKREKDDKIDDIMYPPVIQNMEATLENLPPNNKNPEEVITEDKKGTEALNYKGL